MGWTVDEGAWMPAVNTWWLARVLKSGTTGIAGSRGGVGLETSFKRCDLGLDGAEGSPSLYTYFLH